MDIPPPTTFLCPFTLRNNRPTEEPRISSAPSPLLSWQAIHIPSQPPYSNSQLRLLSYRLSVSFLSTSLSHLGLHHPVMILDIGKGYWGFTGEGANHEAPVASSDGILLGGGFWDARIGFDQVYFGGRLSFPYDLSSH